MLSDLDGTLFHSGTYVSKRNKAAIRNFVVEGGRFGIATGRSLTNASAFLEGVEINGPCILANGALLYDYETGSYLAERGISKEGIGSFLERCRRERPKISIQVYSREMCYIITPPENVDSAIIKNHTPLKFVRPEDVREFAWIKLLFIGNEEEIGWLEKESAQLEAERCVSRVRSAKNFYEFLPYGSSKGSMLSELRRYINDKDVIYAMGDYYNDMEMLSRADVGIAVGNAPEEVKECADRVCADCDRDAAADVIEHML